MNKPAWIARLLVLWSLPALAAAPTLAVPLIPSGGDIPKKFVTVVHSEPGYTKREAKIPMRDGVLLHTILLIPEAITRGPVLLVYHIRYPGFL